MVEVIRTDKVTKLFGQTLAVDTITINVTKGEIYGFLGLNGAGKTTLIRLLLGLIKPTSGKVYLHGKEVKQNSTDIWKEVGYLVETPYSYPDLTVEENLEIIRRLRGISEKDSVFKIMEKLNISKYRKIKAKHLSLGNAQRLGIAKALIHNPSILILDEPANGLDPAGIVEIRELLHNLSYKEGITIFISSHNLAEIAKFSNRIGIIHEGKLVQELTIQDLQMNLHKRLIVNARDHQILYSILTDLGYELTQNSEKSYSLTEPRAIDFPDEIAKLLVQKNAPPTLLKVEVEDLESYFLRTIKTKEVIS